MEQPDKNTETLEQVRAKTHLSMRQIASQHGIPFSHLRAAKVLGGPGFKSNNSINWLELEPWFREHESEIAEKAEQSLEGVRRENLLKDGVLKDLQIQNLRGELLEKAKIHTLLKRIASAQSSLLNSKLLKELPTKLAGKSVADITNLLTQATAEIYQVLGREISEWERS